MKTLAIAAFATFLTALIMVNTASAIPHCKPCPYSCGDLGLGGKDCSQAPSSGGICCVDLSKYGYQLAQARDQAGGSNPAPSYQSPCPAGFHPASSGCTPQERKRGCKDLRGLNNQTCVSGK